MKILDRITLIIYSLIMLVLSVVLGLLVFGWLDMELIGDFCRSILVGDISSKVLIGVCIIFILLSIKCIFFGSRNKAQTKGAQGILLENGNGKLMISKDTIENLVNSTAREFGNAQEITTKVELDRENNVRVFATLVVSSNAVIKDLSAKLQDTIKEKIKTVTDLEVKEVNIRIKNVAEQVRTTEQN